VGGGGGTKREERRRNHSEKGRAINQKSMRTKNKAVVERGGRLVEGYDNLYAGGAKHSASRS